jgi:hypothetical protein
MQRLLLLLSLCGVAAAAVAVQPGVRAQLIGGTVPGVKPKSITRLDLTGADALVIYSGKLQFQINYGSVNTLEYGQSVSRRYAAAILISPILLLSKTHKHFLTLGYVDQEGRQQALVFRVNKGDIRVLLGSLEARTGRRVEYLDAEARKSGKG